MQNFTMPAQGHTFTLPTGKAFMVLATVLIAGVLACVAFIAAALIAVAYLLNLAVSALVELVAHMAAVYSGADSLTKVIIWLVVLFLLLKVWPCMRRAIVAAWK